MKLYSFVICKILYAAPGRCHMGQSTFPIVTVDVDHPVWHLPGALCCCATACWCIQVSSYEDWRTSVQIYCCCQRCGSHTMMKTRRCWAVCYLAGVDVLLVSSEVLECWQSGADLCWCCPVMMLVGRHICRLVLIGIRCSILMRNVLLIGVAAHISCIQWKLQVLCYFLSQAVYKCNIEICYKVKLSNKHLCKLYFYRAQRRDKWHIYCITRYW